MKEKDSSIDGLQSKLEEVSAARKETDKELAKLRAYMDQELARVQGEFEDRRVVEVVLGVGVGL